MNQTPTPPAPGEARWEFNYAARTASSSAAMVLLIAVFASAAEGVARERQRDTWLGLLATPLTGGEILRGKLLGAVRRTRAWWAQLLAVWLVALAAGAVHPAGFVVATAWLAAACVLCGALGFEAALATEPGKLPVPVSSWPLALLAGLGLTLLLTVVPMAVTSAALWSYEDVRAAAHGGAFPLLEWTTLRHHVGARGVTAAVAAVTAVTAAGTALYARSLARRFDALVGRPTRPAPGARPALDHPVTSPRDAALSAASA